jgi:methylmalonyl-CoA mutase, N-terminal domain
MNNIVRVTVAALAAVLGGVQTMHTSAFDEAFATPTPEAAELALRTQQVLMHETKLLDVVDPFGGAWALETRTAEIEQEVLQLLDEIEQLGGAVACIESGWFSDELVESAYREQMEIESGERRIVGTNIYRSESRVLEPQVFRPDPSGEQRQVARLAEIRASRDGARVSLCLKRLEADALSGANVVPATIDAVRALTTVGEISDTLRRVFGTHNYATGNRV